MRFLLLALLLACPTGEVLYNGIELPSTWPPTPSDFAWPDPVEPPYLKSPPEIIPIDVGRQLFVDDFLVQQTTLQREFHRPVEHPKSPVLRPESQWETLRSQPFAAPFSDGVWFDPKDGLFKMWYLSSYGYGTGIATSKDGLHWDRGSLLKIEPFGRDSSTVWQDLDDDPARRYKMLYYRAGLFSRTSADGIAWSEAREYGRLSNAPGDRTTFFYNPFRKVWVYSLRDQSAPQGRKRRYAESAVFGDLQLKDMTPYARWACADKLDRIYPVPYDKNLPDLYNLDGVAYESLMLGLFTVQYRLADDKGRPKLNQLTVGYSRDGFHWHRPDRRPFIAAEDNPESWKWGNVQSVGGGCLVVGDKLHFYYSARNSGTRGAPDTGWGGATGLAVLRRDGFASMNGTGTLTTRRVKFSGSRLFVNLDGELRVDALDDKGQVVKQSETVTADSTIAPVAWKNGGDLSSLGGKPARFRFHLKKGKLYSFWVSPDASGASGGYIAAGGPGFTGHRDTVGIKALESPAKSSGCAEPAESAAEQRLWTDRVPRPADAKEHFAAPDGKGVNPGTKDAPWDLVTAFSHPKAVQPGDVIWIRGGTYSLIKQLSGGLKGTEERPIIVRAFPGERVTLDMGENQSLRVALGGSHTWYWGLELTSKSAARWSAHAHRGDGVSIGASTGVKCVNLVLHDLIGAFGSWREQQEGEIYGCLIYFNGYDDRARGHGHAIYAQNSTTTPRSLIDNIMFGQYSHGIHVYGSSKVGLDRFHIEGNIGFDNGALSTTTRYTRNFLIGGGRVAESPTVIGNVGYFSPLSEPNHGIVCHLDYGQGSRNAVVKGNYFAFGGGTALTIRSQGALVEDNTLYGKVLGVAPEALEKNSHHAGRPSGAKIFVRPNRYEPGRGHVAIFNWDNKDAVPADLASILAPGDKFEVRDAQNYFGPAVASGSYEGKPVEIPMGGTEVAVPVGGPVRPFRHTPKEFGAFIVVRP